MSLTAAQPADTIVTDATIYTVDATHRTVQSLAIRDGKIVYAGDAAGVLLDAYTINGARSLNRDREIGSLEVGKSADFAVLKSH